MSAHTCERLTSGCYRCDLNVDEMRGALEDVRAELAGTRLARIHLADRERELKEEIRELSRAIDTWDMGLAPAVATEDNGGGR